MKVPGVTLESFFDRSAYFPLKDGRTRLCLHGHKYIGVLDGKAGLFRFEYTDAAHGTFVTLGGNLPIGSATFEELYEADWY